jgi:hypothetical protein
MIRVSFSFFVCSVIVAGLVAGGSFGCSKDDDKGVPAKVLPNPNSERTDAPPANAILDDCSPMDECTGAASCMGNCGLHELGDRACTCGANVLTCTACALNTQFRATVPPAATAFCAAGTDDGDVCLTKGEACIDISYNNAGVGRREGCLCWMGRTRLEWDCSQTLNGFFEDMAPPTPPRPDAGATDAPAPPPPPPPAADAAVTTD